MKKIILLFTVFLSTLFYVSFAQNIGVNGTVNDLDGNPLPGVSILIKGTSKGTTTDINGSYNINTLPGETLVFSYLGFETQEVTITQNIHNVILVETDTQLEEVVVTAFGIKKETKELGYSVTKVQADDINLTGKINPLEGLQGKVAGLQVSQTSGSPGGGIDILIRGVSSINPARNNQPLIIVDGVAINNDNFTGEIRPSAGTNSPSSSEQFSFSSRSGDINPDDIESYNILKGAAATALYGIRAANGAIVITTKKGKKGKAKVNVSLGSSIRKVTQTPELQSTYREGWAGRPEILYTPETATGFTKVHSSTPFHTWGPKFSDDSYEFAPDNIVDLTNDKFYNYYEDFFQTGVNNQASFNISGADEKIDYFLSAAYNNDKSIVPNSDYAKISFRFNAGYQILDNLKLSSSISYTKSGGRRANGGDKSIISSLAYFTPTFPINDYKNSDGTQRNFTPWIDNPRYFAEVSGLKDDVNRWIGGFTLNWSPKEWLNITYQAQVDNYSDQRNRFVPPELDVGSQVGGFVINEDINFTGLESNLLFTFSREFNEDFNGSLTLGHQVSDSKREYNRASGEGLNIANFNDISNTTNRFNSYEESHIRNVGAFGEAKVGYQNKLFLTLTGRNDWISTLPKKNRSFFYSSVSASYIFSEDLLKDNDILSFGKLRASWAEVGKGPIYGRIGHNFATDSNFPFGGTGGFSSNTNAGDENILPEKTSSFEIGTDLRFLENRITLDYSYFKSRVNNQIFDVTQSPSTGLSEVNRNAGDYETYGHELLLSGDILREGELFWNMTVNFTKSEGKVLELPDDVDNVLFATSGWPGVNLQVKEGDKMGSIYGYKWRYENGKRFIASNGFPQIITSESVIVGNAFPDFVLSIGNQLKYKNFTLDFLFEWKEGGDKYSLGMRNMIRNGTAKLTELRNVENYVFDGVMEDPNNAGQYITNTQQVTLDQNYYRSSSQFNRASEILVQDASWLKLRNVGISYALSNDLLESLPFSSVLLNISAQNLLLWTPYDGFDPEGSSYTAGSNVYGFSGLGIPLTESYSFNLKIGF